MMNRYKTIDPAAVSSRELHHYMIDAVGPRPICFASTVNEEGVPNLAPYSFFNCFSSNPPTLVFSSNIRGRDGTQKDTLKNIEATMEVVINVVSYRYVRKAALASVEFLHGTSEFEKAGFTPIPSDVVKPFRVKESPVNFECKVKDIYRLGTEGGAGNLFICEVQLMHISEFVLGPDGKIDHNKIDLCGRMGGARYVRASGDAVFEVVQPTIPVAIGFDTLPASVRTSNILTGNDLARLAAFTEQPVVPEYLDDYELQTIYQEYAESPEILREQIHLYARKMLDADMIDRAWQILLYQPEG